MTREKHPRLRASLLRWLSGANLSKANVIRHVLGRKRTMSAEKIRNHPLRKAIDRELARVRPLQAGEGATFETHSGIARGLVTLIAYQLPAMFTGIEDKAERIEAAADAGLKVYRADELPAELRAHSDQRGEEIPVTKLR